MQSFNDLNPLLIIKQLQKDSDNEISLKEKEVHHMLSNYGYMKHSDLSFNIKASKYFLILIDNNTLMLMSNKGHLIQFTDKLKSNKEKSLETMFEQDCSRL